MAFSRAAAADDDALLAAFALGDESASAAFLRRFQGRVYGLALSIIRDQAIAEDISQEVFVRAWRAAQSYDPRRGTVLTWLLTITRNAAIDAMRARRSIPAEDEILDHLLHATLDAAPATEDLALNRAEVQSALRFLQGISRPQARAVVLATLGGCTAAEISRLEDIPLGTAKTRIRDGLRRIRQHSEAAHD
ncbi:sigma-70 family RNA polymerase sigma factor [Nesterenkonia muleiensis]|uniref:sigma-70 family RNA polymerase sigma factor n=1 Tax=Nesterenkonia muleiensis TaxID=2282648 RepID=UPI000E735EDC|nr:sigma-70 family RNA polymerase sigma factor [Nesterenkonia muleiensis]